MNVLLAQATTDALSIPMALVVSIVSAIFGAGAVYSLVMADKKQLRIEMNEAKADIRVLQAEAASDRTERAVMRNDYKNLTSTCEGMERKLDEVESLLRRLLTQKP